MTTSLPDHPSTPFLRELFSRRIALLDGAMGTMIQQHPLTEEDFRGERFKGHSHDLKGNNDLLSITRPDVIKGIHRAYFEAGSDIVETNTFSSTTVSQADYALEDAVREINIEGARVAREAADEYMEAHPGRQVFVAGSVGPTNRTASMSPDVNNPGYRAVTFDSLVVSYSEQIEALLDGDVDLLLLETVFDTLNLKAAIFARHTLIPYSAAQRIVRQRHCCYSAATCIPSAFVFLQYRMLRHISEATGFRSVACGVIVPNILEKS